MLLNNKPKQFLVFGTQCVFEMQNLLFISKTSKRWNRHKLKFVTDSLRHNFFLYDLRQITLDDFITAIWTTKNKKINFHILLQFGNLNHFN